MEHVQQFTLTFATRDRQHVNQIATKLKARASELSGYTGMTFSPPLGPPGSEPGGFHDEHGAFEVPRLLGEDDVTYSARKARLEAQATEARRIVSDTSTPVESPLVKFGRAFDAAD